jgi:hypothetical protein
MLWVPYGDTKTLVTNRFANDRVKLVTIKLALVGRYLIAMKLINHLALLKLID